MLRPTNQTSACERPAAERLHGTGRTAKSFPTSDWSRVSLLSCSSPQHYPQHHDDTTTQLHKDKPNN